MRWWLITDPPCIMSVDNASVKGMDFSELVINDPDLYFVQWIDGKGELERQEIVDGSGDGDRNLNGLRESFIDITPYVPVFQQFLEGMKLKNLLLNQAKKIQIELIHELFNSKRQLPYHYEIAAGNYWWDASDETMGASTALGTQNVTVTVNELNAAVTKLINDINDRIDVINSGISNVGNTFVAQVNATVVNGTNTAFSNLASETYNDLTYPGNLLSQHLDNTVIGDFADMGVGGTNTINGKLAATQAPASPLWISGPPGIAKGGYTFGTITAWTIGSISPGNFSSLTYIPESGVGDVVSSDVQWIPWGETVSVTVTPDEQTAIMNGIAQRTNDLNLAKNIKISEVIALTAIDDVINYDVLADWPIIELPPNYPGSVLVFASGIAASVAVMPSTPSGGGVPEAPNDGVTYGRRNLAWNPALAKSNDVLDGGNF